MSQTQKTPLPKIEMAVVICILTAEAAAYSFLFPFVPFMVRGFGVDEEDVGAYSGWIASAFMMGQFLSSLLWGWMSDKIGVRPVMLFGLGSTMIGTTAFGFSTTLSYAVSLRFISGFLNSNIGACKTFIGLVTDETNEAEAFGMMALCWGAGNILGPTIGGLLSEPATKYTSVFPSDSLFGQLPYLLPCLVTAAIPACGLAIGAIYLPEPPRGGVKAAAAGRACPLPEAAAGDDGRCSSEADTVPMLTLVSDSEDDVEAGSAGGGSGPGPPPQAGDAVGRMGSANCAGGGDCSRIMQANGCGGGGKDEGGEEEKGEWAGNRRDSQISEKGGKAAAAAVPASAV